VQRYLTAAQVAALKAPGRYAVGDGAYLQISKWHTRAWIFRYERFGKAHHMGLGPYPLISLADARAKARNAKRMLLDGIDPLHAKRKARNDALLEIARTKTFKECAEAYIATHDSDWSNAKSRAAWTSTLQNYAYPKIGALPVADIDTPTVLAVLEPIWSRIPTVASRVRGRIETVLGWAGARGYRSTENPARWTGHLEHILPSPSGGTEHLASLPYQQMPEIMPALGAACSIAARALEFAILTACRTAEVRGARWDEFDVDAKTWTIPASRMKAGREHKVPLSDRAFAILADLPRNDALVFPSVRAGKGLGNHAFLRVLERLKYNDVTAHGFRSSFRTWAAECTGLEREVAEMALAHTIPSAVERSYKRTTLFDRRRLLMQMWADFCAGKNVEGEVVPLRGSEVAA
jgi:integrase